MRRKIELHWFLAYVLLVIIGVTTAFAGLHIDGKIDDLKQRQYYDAFIRYCLQQGEYPVMAPSNSAVHFCKNKLNNLITNHPLIEDK